MTKPCSLYVIATVIDGQMVAPVKVGIAKNAKKRLSDFQTASAHELALAYEMHFPTRRFCEEIERATHELSKVVGCHRRGEWINLDPSDAMILIACGADAAFGKGASDHRIFAKYLAEQARLFVHLNPDALNVISFPTKSAG